jgi:monoamine oxidase
VRANVGFAAPDVAKLRYLHSMPRLTRRSLLAASATFAAERALAQPRRAPAPPPDAARSGSVDAVVVGAGAAGIAAARRLLAARQRIVVLEAADEIGGRCITDSKTFSVPYDRGAHWIYAADTNPVARLATQTGLDLYPAPPGQRMRIGRRYAREGEMEDFLANLVRANAGIADAARRGDIACAQALPKDLGEWRSTIDFVLGPYGCGKDLSDVSVVDLARSAERDNSVFCRQGLGALVARLGAGLPIQLSTPVKGIEWWSRRRIIVQTTKGEFRTDAVIVTASTNVLAGGKIRFEPELPRRVLDALTKLKLGSRDHIALELNGNPLALRRDELVFEKSDNRRTAAIFANVYGSTLCLIDVGGSFGRELAAKGEAAMVDFATGWLSGLYGIDVKNVVKRSHATRWDYAPWVLGGSSCAAPGAQSARKTLLEPLSGRIFLAGEAAHETLWGTVGGAWESGERAAAEAVRAIRGR